jgi:serine/arginine repetitive matrix protein 2
MRRLERERLELELQKYERRARDSSEEHTRRDDVSRTSRTSRDEQQESRGPKGVGPREVGPREISPREISPKEIVPREIEPSDTRDRSKDRRKKAAAAGVTGVLAAATISSIIDKVHEDEADRTHRTVKQVVPIETDDSTMISDDILFDPDFFKKRRAVAVKADVLIENAATIEVLTDLEQRYAEPSQNQADFFNPKEWLDQQGSVGTKADVNAGADIHVSQANAEHTGGPPYNKPYAFTTGSKDIESSWSVPMLNLIEPTPPASRAPSVIGDRSVPVSPAVAPKRAEDVAVEPLDDGKV